MVRQKIVDPIHCVAVAARQIGKVNWCVLGDEDMGLYHKSASARLCADQIKVIQHNGGPHYSTEV